MRKSRFTDDEMSAILKEGDTDATVAEICARHGISAATWYRWKKKDEGLPPSDLARLRDLESENAGLKRLCADLAQENAAIRSALSRNF